MTDNVVFLSQWPILANHQHSVADEWLFRFIAVQGAATLRIILR